MSQLRNACLVLGTLLALGLAPVSASPPTHDACSDARAIGQLPYVDTVANAHEATTGGLGVDPFPSCSGSRRENTVWYRYTAGRSGPVQLSTLASDYDTVLWVGDTPCGNWNEIACDDGPGGVLNRAELTFDAVAGQDYYILAAAKFRSFSPINLVLEASEGDPPPGPPANDECTTPTEITTVPQTLSMEMAGTTAAAGDVDPTCRRGATHHTVWFRFSPETTQQVRFSSEQSTWAEVTLTVATGACGDLVSIDCDRDTGVNGKGIVDFLAEEGQTYLIQASSVYAAQPTDTLQLDVTPGISNPLHVQVLDASTAQPLPGAHVWVSDLSGHYLEREGTTDVDGRLTLYPPDPTNQQVQVIEPTYVVEAEPFSNTASPANVQISLNPMQLPQPPSGPTRIAFFAQDGTLRTMLPDGSDLRIIGSFPQGEYPVWSGDGEYLAFLNGNPKQIYTVKADGTELTQITNMPGGGTGTFREHLDWSPDGQEFVFQEADFVGTRHVYKVNADGSGKTQIDFDAVEPGFSPDSTMIVLRKPGVGATWVMKRDGSDATKITTNLSGNPDWSPDGSKISVGRSGGLFTFDSDGLNIVEIRDTFSDFLLAPQWSPESDRIVFLDEQLGGWYLTRVLADGSSAQVVYPADVDLDAGPSWAPDTTADVPGDAAPRVRLITPNGGEVYAPGDVVDIRWTVTDDFGPAGFDLYRWDASGSRFPLAEGLPGDARRFGWTVPDVSSLVGSWIQITARDTVGQDVWDFGDAAFTVARPTDDYLHTKLLYPLGGESFVEGEQIEILWEATSNLPWDVPPFEIQLSVDGGFSYNTIGWPAEADRSFLWTVPSDVSDRARIAVRSHAIVTASSTSGQFRVNAGAAGVDGLLLAGGQSTVLQWTAASGASAYDVLRGNLSELRYGGDQVLLGQTECMFDDLPSTTTANTPDLDVPAVGAAYFYLVRPEGVLAGGWGHDADGWPRHAAMACP